MIWLFIRFLFFIHLLFINLLTQFLTYSLIYLTALLLIHLLTYFLANLLIHLLTSLLSYYLTDLIDFRFTNWLPDRHSSLLPIRWNVQDCDLRLPFCQWNGSSVSLDIRPGRCPKKSTCRQNEWFSKMGWTYVILLQLFYVFIFRNIILRLLSYFSYYHIITHYYLHFPTASFI